MARNFGFMRFVLVLLLMAFAGHVVAQPVSDGRTVLDAWLNTIPNADRAQRTELAHDAVGRFFPSYRFFVVWFRSYPVAMLPPEPLKLSNVVAIDAHNKITLLTTEDELEEFFQAAAPPVKDVTQGKEAVRAWLSIVQELRQDGFFKFDLPEDSVSAGATEDSVIAKGKITASHGGEGEIDATLTFDSQGTLEKQEMTQNIKPGIRPICQATKLLDSDPVVRKMAEQDLLVMGLAAHDYLMERRKLASPALQKEIDRIWNRIVTEKW